MGTVTTGPILFNTNPATTAAAIQSALLTAGFTGATVSAQTTTNSTTDFDFHVSFLADSGISSSIQYVATTTNALPSTVTLTTTAAQGAADVRLLTNPTQQLLLTSTTANPGTGTFELQIGTVTTGAIAFNSAALPSTASAIQSAIQSAGFIAATVSVDSASTATQFRFDIEFAGATAGDDLPAITFVPVSLPSTVTGSMYYPTGDPYTELANVNYTNPQYEPDVAMNVDGSFVIVWANQGPDISYFNNISMERYDKNGNPIAYVSSVNDGALTNDDFAPSVALGTDGNVVVTYSETNAIGIAQNPTATATIYARAFSSQSTPLWNQIEIAANGAFSTVSMDGQDNFMVSWQANTDADVNGQTSEGVYAAEYEIENYGISGATFGNSAVSSSAAQQLTFSVTNVPVTGTYQLQVGTVTTSTITFNSATPGAAATAMQAALVASGFAGARVVYAPSPASADTFIYNVSFTTAISPVKYVANGVLAAPTTLRKTYRVNSTSTNTGSETVWPFDQSAADVQMDVNGDTAFTYQGNGPAVSENVAIPAAFFEKYFSSTMTQDLSFDFAGGVPTFTSANDQFYLQVGTTTTGEITFSSNATTTATNIRKALATAGFTGATVTGTLAGSTYTFVVTFTNLTANEPTIQYLGALPSTVTFANSVTAAAASQQLTFTATTVPVSGGIELQVGTVTTNPIYFNSADPTATAAAMQAALVKAGFTGATVTVDASTTTNSFVFDITFTASEAPIQMAAAIPALPSTVIFTETTTTQVQNADLLQFFNPYQGFGLGSDFPFLVQDPLYKAQNENVDTAIGQALFFIEGEGATNEQLGRLQAIFNDVAGLLRGDSNGILMTQVDANSEDSLGQQQATYSDNIVSTQRDGQDQRYYITVPTDVQMGSFQLQLIVSPSGGTQPADVVSFQITTGTINMPSTAPGAPGGPINTTTTMDDIATEIDAALGTIWPGTIPTSGAVDVRLVPASEISARNGTIFQLPQATILAEKPTVTVPGTTATPPTLVSKEPPFIFELLFQGQANDVNIAVNVVNANDEQWVDVPTVSNNTVTYTETLEAASPVVATLGDYAGEQGSNQSNAALAMDSEGDMVAAYTNQPLQTDGSSPIDANGDITDQGIYAEQLDETTNIAGPQVVDWTDSNGTDLLKGGTAVGVDSQYFVLTFDQAMLADNPALDSDSVFDLANYQLYNANGTLMTNAFTTANYGLSEVAAMATSTPGFTTNLDSYIPDNKFEVVLTLNSTLPNGTYTLEVLNAIRATSTSAGQTGLANIYGSPLNLTGYNPSGSDFIETVTISGSLNPGTAAGSTGIDGDGHSRQRHSRRHADRSVGRHQRQRRLRRRLDKRRRRADEHRRPTVQVVGYGDRHGIHRQSDRVDLVEQSFRGYGLRRRLCRHLVGGWTGFQRDIRPLGCLRPAVQRLWSGRHQPIPCGPVRGWRPATRHAGSVDRSDGPRWDLRHCLVHDADHRKQ